MERTLHPKRIRLRLGHKEFQPQLFSTFEFEKLIPKNHLLRKIDRTVDFSFIREFTKDLYRADNGRPSIDPEIFFRIYLISFLYGIESDRQTCEEIQYSLAYRWFCKMNIEEAVPDHSSLTRIRDRMGEEIFKRVFDHIVRICFERGLAKSTKVMMDGSIVKADAALRSMVDRPKDGESISEQVPPKYIKDRRLRNKEHVSKTDPECSFAGKVGEPKKLCYKVHNTIDRDSRIVLDMHATPGAEMEGSIIMNRIDAYENNFGKKIEELAADRGYGYGVNLQRLEERGIDHFVPNFRPDVGEAWENPIFDYNQKLDIVTCPMGHELGEQTTAEVESKEYFNRYQIKSYACYECPLNGICSENSSPPNPNNRKSVTRNVYIEMQLLTKKREADAEFKKMRGERQWKLEGGFAEAKENHCLSRARYRGLAKMHIPSYMIGMVLNLKRLIGAAEVPIEHIENLVRICLQSYRARHRQIFFEIFLLAS